MKRIIFVFVFVGIFSLGYSQCGGACGIPDFVISNSSSYDFKVSYFSSSGGSAGGTCVYGTATLPVSFVGTVCVPANQTICIPANGRTWIAEVIIRAVTNSTCDTDCNLPGNVISLFFPNHATSGNPSTGTIYDCGGYAVTADFYTCFLQCGVQSFPGEIKLDLY